MQNAGCDVTVRRVRRRHCDVIIAEVRHNRKRSREVQVGFCRHRGIPLPLLRLLFFKFFFIL